MKSYLLSMLRGTLNRKGDKELLRAHPHDWLLWEPGSWRPGSSGTALVKPQPFKEETPDSAGEGLALALILKPDANEIRLGRGPSCDLVINDGTVSTVHLVFTHVGGWRVRDVGSTNGSWVDGSKLLKDLTFRLSDGTKLKAGQVDFTFYTSAGLVSRLRGKPRAEAVR